MKNAIALSWKLLLDHHKNNLVQSHQYPFISTPPPSVTPLSRSFPSLPPHDGWLDRYLSARFIVYVCDVESIPSSTFSFTKLSSSVMCPTNENRRVRVGKMALFPWDIALISNFRFFLLHFLAFFQRFFFACSSLFRDHCVPGASGCYRIDENIFYFDFRQTDIHSPTWGIFKREG